MYVHVRPHLYFFPFSTSSPRSQPPSGQSLASSGSQQNKSVSLSLCGFFSIVNAPRRDDVVRHCRIATKVQDSLRSLPK
ncbi:Hypothetical protein NTJ_13090 [Nesidiocoris tenuis]|uniref:Uncharacterized protein n=1 Tax=Nesidiocoris tenuis TaxID=355587 RepID=A0ABN7B7A2_9HEMI|nr:Hypothetical protein NTJ_03953 [Nesidiocoris tenuis]BET00274.1 Hypothetical protein NTJ_13090 [Nesidiocoris tenuis]